MNTVTFKIRRQDDPADLSYWETFVVERRPGMSVLDVLAAIALNPVSNEGEPTRPVVHECSCHKGKCGACAMIINGNTRLACETPVDELDSHVKLEPLSKFPIIKDLKVDRKSMTGAISAFNLWIDAGLIQRAAMPMIMTPSIKERSKAFEDCAMCGCCVEVCMRANDRNMFAGAFVFARAAIIFSHPMGRDALPDRFHLLAQKGGLGECRGALACETFCPKGVPLSRAVTALNWEANRWSLRSIFGIATDFNLS